MADTTFVDGTVVVAAWLNDVNDFVYGTDQVSVMNYIPIAYHAAIVAGTSVVNVASYFLLASQASPRVYVPAGTYLVTGLNVDYGVKFVGPGKIKTSAGSIIPVSVSEAPASPEMRVMFMEGDTPSYEELLDIRSTGCTTVMCYPWNITDAVLVKNCEAVGLNVIMHSRFTSVPNPVVPNTALDARASIVGYYLCDEPIGNAQSVTDQDRAITAYRAVTRKPLFCAENSVIYRTASQLSTNWDVIFSDVYYANAMSAGIEPLTQALRNYSEYPLQAPNAKIIPLLGLFNDTGYTKSTTLTTQLAECTLKFSPDGSYGIYIWDAGLVHGAYSGVRNIAAYKTAANNTYSQSLNYQPYKVVCVPVGLLTNSKLHEVAKTTIDGASPGLIGTPTMLPWETTNTGSATDTRRQTFAQDGIMTSTLGGTLGFKGCPAGLCASIFTYTNVANAATCIISLGYSETGGYTYTNVSSSAALAVGASVAQAAVLSSTPTKMPMLKTVLSISTGQPYAYLGSGYISFSDVPSVTF